MREGKRGKKKNNASPTTRSAGGRATLGQAPFSRSCQGTSFRGRSHPSHRTVSSPYTAMQSLKSFYNRLASPSKKKIESRPESTTSLSAKAAQDISALNENLRRLLQSLRRYQDQLHTEDDFFNREEYMQARIVAIKGYVGKNNFA